jgi:hypothetical protein
MKISVFGNPDLCQDSLPIRVLPKLRKKFPNIKFVEEDPNELNLPETDEWLIVDTVVGIREVQLLTADDLKNVSKKISMHDFDLAAHLFWINKIKKGLKTEIIGIPPMISEDEAIEGISKIISHSISLRENERHN